ncbi:MAG: outer membrane protein transport protein [Gammaproteobacteria bacterium]|nr:outer membrane protein transport protein [Gammaproteobacteria bacterium]
MPWSLYPDTRSRVSRFVRIGAGLLTASCFCHSAHATNGYSPTGFGTINKGMVGAGVALPQDAMTAATNPAGMGLVGSRTDVGLALFSPSDRGFTANDDGMYIEPGDYTSENDYFLIPHFGWNKQLSEHSSFGISIGGNGGMNTEYDTAVFGNFGDASSPTGVDFSQLFLGATYAHEVSQGHWLGIMPIVAVQRFEAKGLEPFDNPYMTTATGKVTNNGYDVSWGYGVRIGWIGKVSEQLSLAASYQSRLYMSEFEDYEGLFAEQGDFDTPSTWVIGLAYAATPDVTLVLDYQRINYGEVKSLSNGNDLNFFSNPDYRLGSDEGLGFGWDDMNILKLGIQWEYNPQWTFRAGYSHASELFEGGQALFNILAPATIRDHISLGSTYSYSDSNRVSMSLTHALEEKVEGSNPVFTGSQTGSVQMEQWEIELSWTHLF